MKFQIIPFLIVHTSRATLDIEQLTQDVAAKVQTIKDKASAGFQQFVDTIDFDKVKQLDILGIVPKVQKKIEFKKNILAKKKDFKQKLFEQKQQLAQNLIAQKQQLFAQKQKLLAQKHQTLEDIGKALIDEKQKLIEQKHGKLKEIGTVLIGGKKLEKVTLIVPSPSKHLKYGEQLRSPPYYIVRKTYKIYD